MRLHLICNIGFVNANSIKEDFILCNMIEILDTFISENNFNTVVSVLMRLALCLAAYCLLIRSKSRNALWTRSTIHRKALAPKHLRPTLNQVLECVVNILTLITYRPLKVRSKKTV